MEPTDDQKLPDETPAVPYVEHEAPPEPEPEPDPIIEQPKPQPIMSTEKTDEKTETKTEPKKDKPAKTPATPPAKPEAKKDNTFLFLAVAALLAGLVFILYNQRMKKQAGTDPDDDLTDDELAAKYGYGNPE